MPFPTVVRFMVSPSLVLIRRTGDGDNVYRPGAKCLLHFLRHLPLAFGKRFMCFCVSTGRIAAVLTV
jgi:hypothetical protein